MNDPITGRPMIVEISKGEDRWLMCAAGFAWGLLTGGLCGVFFW